MMGYSMMGWFWIWPVLMLIGLVLLGYLAYRLTQSRSVPGSFEPMAHDLSRTAVVDGYQVTLSGDLVAGQASPLTPSVSRDGRPEHSGQRPRAAVRSTEVTRK